MIEALVPWHRREPLFIGDVCYRVPARVLAHVKTLVASLDSLARTCTAQAERIKELEAKPKSIRWTPGMKHAVVLLAKASAQGRIEAMTAFDLTPEELDGWIAGFERLGINGLKVGSIERLRGKHG